MRFLRDFKRVIVSVIAGLSGAIVLIDFASRGELGGVRGMAATLIDWSALLVALALVVGLMSVAASHFVRVWLRNPDWVYSLVLLVSMMFAIVSGTIVGLVPNPDGGWPNFVPFPKSLGEQPIRDLFRAVYQPLAGSFLALLAFFSLSAALRALKHRTTEAIVIMTVAVIVLLGIALPIASGLPIVQAGVGWVYAYVIQASARGILIGVALGTVVAGLRVLLGFDQPYFDR